MEIVDAIEQGRDLPDDFYREHKGRSDRLLVELGIMHLHLTPGSNELLFLRQFEDCVELIEINDHSPFDPNAVEYFNRLYKTKLYQSQRQMELRRRTSSKKLTEGIAKLKGTRKLPETPSEE